MGRFLSRLSRHAKPALRLFACELAGVLLFRQVCALLALLVYKSTNTVTGGAACKGDDSSDAATYADVC